MADKQLSGAPPPSRASPGRIGGAVPKSSPTPHQNGSVDSEPGCPASSTRTVASTSPLMTLGGAASPVGPGSEGLGSALSSRTRTTRTKYWSSQQGEPEALLDLILESQCHRLEDQRASLSLLPDPGPAALCGACSPDQPPEPGLEFYYMLIHYQSDRMEDQRCPLPDLDDVIGPVPEGQEDFFSLVQRVQSRRMDEQRASMLLRRTEDEQDAHAAGSAPHRRHHHHHRHHH